MLDELDHDVSEEELLEAQRIADEAEGGTRDIKEGFSRWIIPVLAVSWSVFQLLISSVILLNSTITRSVHLAFAITLVFLSHPTLARKKDKGKLRQYLSRRDKYTLLDYGLALAAGLSALYIAVEMILETLIPGFEGISFRQGIPLTRDLVVGCVLMILLLEAARRSLGPALSIVALLFILYSFFAQRMPGAFSFKSVSITKFFSKMTMSTEGVFGVPLDVSANVVFLFVLFGAMLDKAGAGKYFVDLAFSLLGRFKGGPAKAAVLASGLTGMVSGSSIANTVTTGTFTIPLMKKVGYPDYKAGAIEVACSTNGQLMPPIMGAAAFIIAETCNMAYMEVIKAAFIPAVISYIALIYIAHLEASKLGLEGLKKEDLPSFRKTFKKGVHFLLPLILLVVELVVFRHSPSLSAFRAILLLALLIPIENFIRYKRQGKPLIDSLKHSLFQIVQALEAGAKNMMGIGVAVAAAGIIVGVVTFGLGGIITEAIEVLSGGHFFLILIITAIASLILGMGLPTTATYIVMASLTAPVILQLGAKNGIVFPIIAAHLFVFFFGILADDTPPVGLAAFAAAAIAKSDPIKTGVQGFTYDVRTAILPFMFIFNTDLLLYNVTSFPYAILVFITSMMGMFAFAALTQGYMMVKNSWLDSLVLALSAFLLLMPKIIAQWLGFQTRGPVLIISFIALAVYGSSFLLQSSRRKKMLS